MSEIEITFCYVINYQSYYFKTEYATTFCLKIYWIFKYTNRLFFFQITEKI